jgi:pimeloyl-ACP methyl ester carboxylesterase
VVTALDVPVYFVMGAYDGMTSPEPAKAYLQSLGGEGVKEFVLFEESAHYPQFEEEETFVRWMTELFGE